MLERLQTAQTVLAFCLLRQSTLQMWVPFERAPRNCHLCRLGRQIAGDSLRIPNPIHGPSRAAPADAYEQITRLRMHRNCRRRETVVADRFEKHPRLTCVGRALALQRAEPDLAESPIGQEEAAAILLWKLR